MPELMRASCLVVDDEESICVLLHDILTEQGLRVVEAQDRKSALALLTEEEFDLVLTDKNLPDGSGLDVAAELRRLGHQSEIIVLTGYSDLESAIEAYKFGAYRYIKKPFDIHVLIIEVEGALRTRMLKRDLAHRTIELEQANARLQQSEARFRELAELLPGIVIEMDAALALTFVNRAGLRMTGYEHDLFCSHFFDGTLIDEADRSRWADDLDKARLGMDVAISEYAIYCKDEHRMPVLMQLSPITVLGKQTGLRAVLLDITSRKQTEMALREKEIQLHLMQKMEALGSLAGGVAHDFNNMLGVIRGFCDVMLLDLDLANPMFDDIHSIIDAAERAADLTRQLLVFGRKQILIPEIVDLNGVIRSMEKMIRRLVREDIDVESRLAPGCFYVYVDKSQIEQVIMNLIVNARDAMPDGGHLIIETSQSELDKDEIPCVKLSVRDTGIGMDEATRLRIFEPFFTTKQQGKGTGLGLATVYGIVHQSGGSISVESALGQGACFDVRIPYAAETPTKSASVLPSFIDLTGHETILVVEDEHLLLEVVVRILRNYGYVVLSATHSGDAVLLCEKHQDPINLLLVDVVMPRMNGAELALRLSGIHPEMEVLYMSGYSDFTVVRQVMVENVERFIPKPFAAHELARKVREVLKRAKNPSE